MNDIIRMAREAGFVVQDLPACQPNCIFHTHHMIDDQLKKFADLIAAAEREACAEVCDLEVARLHAIDEPRPALAAGICAAVIRARGQA